MQKIDLDKRNSFGILDWLESWNEPSGAKLIEGKINELVDAVNKLQAQVAILEEHAHPTAKTTDTTRI